ncbi:hypothetical protein LA366_02500 [Aeromonas jandaei]|uniref:Uncharacterized protein n=1 Tax=Aeromonas jandaei TaxID=650 RepID=A0A7T4A8M1_AERJA|nr:hypothetical protein [Aeromonas jandaei]QQB19306.1 hypothetical protein I6H43_17555 [Aeromonas jandaei]UCA33979.1 hypothetical protein LA366_02500 [Aeromonas jandaei]
MTKSILSRAAKSADQIIATIADHVSGNKARRARLHRRVSEIADDIRRQKLAEKRAIANKHLGRIPQGHRLMLILTAQNHSNAV